LKELEPSRGIDNTNVERMCEAMEAELNAIDERCANRLRETAAEYLELMGLPVDGEDLEEIEETAPKQVAQPSIGRPRYGSAAWLTHI
jgi:hypothetical protein